MGLKGRFHGWRLTMRDFAHVSPKPCSTNDKISEMPIIQGHFRPVAERGTGTLASQKEISVPEWRFAQQNKRIQQCEASEWQERIWDAILWSYRLIGSVEAVQTTSPITRKS